MARTRDEQKRKKILQTSKVLFSNKGYANTSISDIVQETEMPVGTIYTYFKRKDGILTAIVEEGWTDFSSQLERIAHLEISGQERLRIIIDKFIPELLKDLNLINILLTETIEITQIEKKMDKITDIIFTIIKDIPDAARSIKDLSRKMLQTSIVVVFLGILSTANLAKTKRTEIEVSDILDFVK
ncbi:MAG TPA: TetR/AcrR family transcriptional regulator, partial [Spirochaetia bacterium]|nr:TetR/AcrR family transcriptional regulator [Spirochaetia bacterium]